MFIYHYFPCSPVRDTVLVNDRWGMDTSCKHGSVLTCSDRYTPGKADLTKINSDIHCLRQY